MSTGKAGVASVRRRRTGWDRLAALALSALALALVALPSGEADAQQVTSPAVLHRDTIVEGQTRAFQITNVPARPEYYLHASVAGSFSAEASDVTITTNNLLGQALTVTPDADGPRAYPDSVYSRIRFEVTANSDGDTDNETFGVRLCTTADCTGGAVLGEWTVTITEPGADTTLSGTGATLTIPGGSAVSVMEISRNSDGRDRRATFSINVTTAPTTDIVIVAKADTGVSTGAISMGPFARINSSLSRDYPPAGEAGHDPVSAEYVVGYWKSGMIGSQEFTIISTDNAVDTAGGTIRGNLRFRVLQGSASGSNNYTNDMPNDAAVYSGIAIPDLPVHVTNDDEPTRLRLLPTSPADNTATEGNTDKASVLVRLERALVAGEEVTALLTFGGATLGTHFTLAAASGQTGVTYADSSDGTRGLVTLAGAGVQEGVIEVTALTDSDSDTQTLQIGMPPTDQPWRPNFHRSNLDGGVCAAHGCPDRPPGDPGQRFQSVTLAEAVPGLTITEHADPDARVVTEGMDYSYTLQLNSAPSNAVTVTTTIASGGSVQAGGTLTFNSGNHAMPQTVTVRPTGNNTDEPRRTLTVTHAFSGDTTYAALSNVTHEVNVLDDDPTTVTMAGAGVRDPGDSNTSSNISRIMVEGDATRVDRTLTITLGRALVDGEYVRVPLRVEAVANGNDPSLPEDPPDRDDDDDPELPSDLDPRRTTVDSARGPRASANVAWPPIHNDVVMTATGTGVTYEHSNRYTPNHIGFRYIEFRGAGAQTATIVVHARDGFDDGEHYDEAFAITFPNDFYVFDEDTDQPFSSAPVDTNLGGGIAASPVDGEAWFGITDDDYVAPVAEAIEVSKTWSLKPPGVSDGARFRLLYVTSGTRNASDDGWGNYDNFVRAEITGNRLVQGGVTDLAPYESDFAAVISVNGGGNASLHANLEEAGSDAPIYWVGGTKVADNKVDFLDGSWDDETNPRHADGSVATISANGYWTGSESNGQRRESCGGGAHHLRAGSTNVNIGKLGDATLTPLGPTSPSAQATCSSAPVNSEQRPLYALSTKEFFIPGGASIEPTASAAEGSAISFTVTITTAAPSGGITIPYTLANGRGASADQTYTIATSADYSDADSGSITIAQGDTTGTITINATEDNTYEGDHYFTVTLGTPTGTDAPSVRPGESTAIGTITDAADAPTFQFDPATVSANEETGTATLTVTRTGTTLVPASVTWTTADGTGASGATHPGDYTSATGTAQFGATESSKTITVDITADSAAESAETFTVVLSDPVEATLGSASTATVTVTDTDTGPPPTVDVTISASSAVAGEGAAGPRLTVTISRALTQGQTVTVPLTFKGATVTDDYGLVDAITASGVSLIHSGGTHTRQNPAVQFTGSGTTAELRINFPENSTRTQPYLVVDYGTADRAPSGSGVTVGTLTGGPIGIVLEDNETGDIEVPADWPLAPSGLSAGDDFRLLFRTSAARAATSSNIADYDAFVHEVLATGGHADILPYAGFFKVFGSTRSSSGSTGTTARVHTGMAAEHTGHVPSNGWTDGSAASSVGSATVGTPVYWLNGAILANNYADLCDLGWSGSGSGVRSGFDADDPRSEDGARNVPPGTTNYQPYSPWTGTGNACEAFNHPLGASTVSYGSADSGGGQTLLHQAAAANTQERPLFGMSPVFKVAAQAALPELSFARATSLVNEDDGTLSVTVNADPAPSANLTVTYSVEDSSSGQAGLEATSGVDFTAPSGTFTINAGATSGTIVITITDDAIFEKPENFRLRLTASSGYTVDLSRGNTTVGINDDDRAELTLGQASYTALESGGAVAITVNLNATAPDVVRVRLTLADGTATGASGGAGADFDSDQLTATIAAGTDTATFNIPITDDGAAELDETFTATLSKGSGGVTANTDLGDPHVATITIADDDHAQGLLLVPSAATGLTLDEGATATYTVRLATAPTGTVTVTITGAGSGITVDTDPSMASDQNTLTFTTSDWYIAQEVTVSAGQDMNAANEMVTLTHAPTGGGYSSSHNADFGVTADDDETAVPVTVTMSASDGDADGNAVENGAGTTGYRTITVTLGRALTGAETVTVPLTVQGATVADDYTFGLQPATQTGVTLLNSGATYTAQNPALRFVSGGTSATLRLRPVNDSDREQPYAVVDFGADSRAPSGVNVTLGDVTGGPIGIVLVDDETGAIEVPSSWGLAPSSGVGPGDDFRLLFRSSSGRDATSTDIADYDAFVREVLATGGHADILPYAGFFKVFGSTRSGSGSTGATARFHNGLVTTGEHNDHHDQAGDLWADGSARSTRNTAQTRIYWLNGPILANNYADLCDLNWTSTPGISNGFDRADPRSEDGTQNNPDNPGQAQQPWTGSGNACEAWDHPLGANTVSRGAVDSTGSLWHASAEANTQIRPLYGLSPVFTVEGATAELSVSASGTVTEGGTLTVTVTLSRNADANLSIPVRMRTSGNPTASAADFTLSNSGSVAITSGTSSGTLTFTAVDDDIDEDAETLVLEFGALPSGVVAGTADSVAITINDNDTAGVTVTQTGGNTVVAENGGTDTYTVALDTQPLTNVVITLTSGVPAAAVLSGGGQTNQGTLTLTFTPSNWNTAQTVTVRGVNDDVDNQGDRRDVTITQAVTTGDTGGKYTTSTAVANVSVRVNDDDVAAVTVTPSGGTTVVTEDQSDTDDYTVVLATQPLGNVTITATAPAGAQVSDDGGSTWGSSVELEFTAGTSGNWGTAQTVTVRGEQDVIDNPGDQRAVTITHAITSGNGDGSRYRPSTPSIDSVAVTVTDDDPAPTAIALSVDDDFVWEGDGATSITVTATVQGATRFGVPKAVVVTVTPLADRSGFNYVDMTAVSPFTITIPAGAQSATGMFTLTPDADVVDEVTNAVTVGGSIGGDTATTINTDDIVLQDDDATPTGVTLSVNPTSITENGGARTVAVTATVDGATRFGTARTVAVTVDGHNAAGRVNFVAATSFNITIPAEDQASAPFHITVTPTNNAWDEQNGAAALSGTLGSVTVTGASVTITDDDATPPGVALSVNRASIAEGAGATSITVTATVRGATRYGSARTVTVSQAGSGGANVVDYTATAPGTITIAAGAASSTTSFTLTPTDDATDEFDETVTVSGSGAGVASVSEAAITLTDDDDTTIAISAPAGGIAENGGTKDVTLTLSRVLLMGETVTVPLEVVGVTAGTDYTVALQPSSQPGVTLSQSGPDSAQRPKVTLGSGAAAAVLRFTAVDDALRQQPYAVVRYGTGARAPSGAGVDFAAPTDGPVGFVLTDDETGAVGVLPSWGLLPSQAETLRLDFRLVFVTSGQRDASSGDIADYDHFIRLHLAEGHADIVPYAGFFTALGSTSGVTLQNHASVSGSASMNFFWLGETGTTGERRLAASNSQFRGEWFEGSTPSQQSVPRDESGARAAIASTGYFTGSTAAGARSSNPLGAASVTLGYLNDSGAGRAPLGSGQTASGTATRGFYGLSPVFSYVGDPAITISSQATSVTEGTAITFTIEADPAPTANLPINLVVSDDGHVLPPAATGIKNGAVTIAANTTSVTYTVNTVGDSTDEPDTAAGVAIAVGENYALGSPSIATVTVEDNDAMTVSVSGGGGTVNEGSSTDYTVDPGRDLDSGETVTIHFAPAGTATRGTDYTISCHGAGVTCTGLGGTTPVLTIRGGSGVRRGTIRVSVRTDSIHPESETAGISLRSGHTSTGSGGPFSVSGTPTTFTISSIAPQAITASFGAAAYSGTEAVGSRTVTVPVNLSAAAPQGGLSIAYAAHSSGTAAAADYGVSPAGSVSIAQGTSSASITVTITDDALHEGSETIVLDISNGSGYSPGATARTTVTITDDDAAPTTVALSVDDDAVGEGDGARTITVTATVGGTTRWGAQQTVAVAVAGSGGQGVVGFTAQPATFNVSIAAGAQTGTGTFTLTPTNNNTVENAETVTVSGTLGGATVSPATITLSDDDTAPATPVTVTLSASGGDADGNAVEGASGATGYRTVTVTLGRALTGAETVTVPLTVVGATVATDYAFALQPSSQAGVTLLTSNPHSAQNPALRLAAGASSATLRLTPVNNGARTQPYVVIAYGTGARAPAAGGGATLGTVTGGPIGVVLVDDETGDVTVPAGWGLKPSALGAGDDFRLLFRSSTARDATSADIADYDAFIRNVVATLGHADVLPYAGFFQVFGSTRSSAGSTGTTARVHTGMAAEHTQHVPSGGWTDGSAASSVGDASVGTPIYWLNGEILANNYADFCDLMWSDGNGVTSGWDAGDPRSEDGTRNLPTGTISDYGPYEAWTGTGNACEAYNYPLGNSQVSRASADKGGGQAFLHAGQSANTQQRPLYGLSPVFKVAGSTSAIAVGFERAHSNVREGTTLQATLTAASASSSSATFTVNATAGTATSGDWSGGPWSVTLPANQTSVSFNVVIPSDTTIEGPERFTLTIAAPPAGFTLGTGTATVQIVDVNVVPGDWALIPAGLTTGQQFRLVFLGDPHPASGGNIATYDGWVQADASSSGTTPTPHAAIQAYSVGFQMVGSTTAVDAAAHTATGISESGAYGHTAWTTPIYWLGGARIADDHNDFWDGGWDSQLANQTRGPDGQAVSGAAKTWTGTQTGATHATAGTASANPLGHTGSNVTQGRWGQGNNPINQGTEGKNNVRRILAISQVFEVGATPATPVADFAAATSTVAEASGTTNIRLNLSPAPSGNITVRYTLSGTATLGTDYTISGGAGTSRTVNVSAGATFVNIPVAVTNDSAQESAETIVLTLNAGAGYSVGTTNPAHTRTISDDDGGGGTPIASFAAGTSTVGEASGTTSLVVNFSRVPSSAITLGYDLSGTATLGTDYTISGGSGTSRTLSVSAGASSVNIPITIVNDNARESGETIIVTLRSSTQYARNEPLIHTRTITDDDGGTTPPPVVVTPPGGGGGGGGPTGPTPSDADFEWNVKRDIESLAGGHDSPTGAWGDGETLWIAQNGSGAADAVHAYDLETGERVTEREFPLDERNRAPRGLASDGETMWVSDSGRDRLFAYDLASGERLPERDIELAAGNRDVRGIWSDGVTMWALNRNPSLYAYDLASGELLAEYALAARNGDPRGIWSDGVTVWVSDHGAKMLFAYRLPEPPAEAAEAEGDGDGEAPELERVQGEEFTHLSRASNLSPRGVWSDRDVIYVADAHDGKVYTYNMPPAIDARLASLALSGVDFGEFASLRTAYEGVPEAGAAAYTVEAVPVRDGAAVRVEPADADPGRRGHQVARGAPAVTVTVTSPDGSRTLVYRVRVRVELPEACLDGAVAEGFSLVVFAGGTIEELAACAALRHVDALYTLSGGRWLTFIPEAPDLVNAPFAEHFAGALPPGAPLVAASAGPATEDPLPLAEGPRAWGPDCLAGERGPGFGLVRFQGGSLEELAACARTSDVVSLWTIAEGEYVAFVPGAPAFVNAAFSALFTGGLPAGEPLLVRVAEPQASAEEEAGDADGGADDEAETGDGTGAADTEAGDDAAADDNVAVGADDGAASGDGAGAASGDGAGAASADADGDGVAADDNVVGTAGGGADAGGSEDGASLSLAATHESQDDPGPAQIVSLSGYPDAPELGALGTGTPAEVAAEAALWAERHDALNGPREAVPAYHLLVAVAQADPTPDGTWLGRPLDEIIARYVEAARTHGLLLFLEIQVGWSDPLAEARLLEPFLAEPFVHLALDPEFATGRLQVAPGVAVGSVTAEDVNAVQRYLASLAAGHGLPPKILIVHQFEEGMIEDRAEIEAHAAVALSISMSAIGDPEDKRARYERFALARPSERPALRLSFDHDTPTMTPADIQNLDRPPDIVIYQ